MVVPNHHVRWTTWLEDCRHAFEYVSHVGEILCKEGGKVSAAKANVDSRVERANSLNQGGHGFRKVPLLGLKGLPVHCPLPPSNFTIPNHLLVSLSVIGARQQA